MKFAICNEMFEDWPFDQICAGVAALGYAGLELAPFTLAPRATDLDAPARRRLRQQAEHSGLQIVGLHWLLARTRGLHLTAAEPEVRRRTAEYLQELVGLCADLGGGVLVLGSPQQRSLAPGTSRQEGMKRAAEVLRTCLPTAVERGVRICIEPLARSETNFITTAQEGFELLRAVDHPGLRLHLDVKAMAAEGRPIDGIIREFGSVLEHFHANDVNLRGPGQGPTDFGPIFRALLDIGYEGWVSVEAFQCPDGPEACARDSLRNMQAALERARGSP